MTTNTQGAADLIAALKEAQSAINSMKVEAETAAQGDEQMMLEACETISNEGLQADMAIRAALAFAAAQSKQETEATHLRELAAYRLTVENLEREIAAQQPALSADSVLEDAARYRWLAEHCRSTSEHWGGRWSIVVEGPAPKSHDSEDDFDAAIDAGRKQGANHDNS